MKTKIVYNRKIKVNQILAVVLVGACSLVLMKIFYPPNPAWDSPGMWRYLIFGSIWTLVFLLFVLKQIFWFGTVGKMSQIELTSFEKRLELHGFHRYRVDRQTVIYRAFLTGTIHSYRDLIIETIPQNSRENKKYFFALTTNTFSGICLFTQHFGDLKFLKALLSEADANTKSGIEAAWKSIQE